MRVFINLTTEIQESYRSSLANEEIEFWRKNEYTSVFMPRHKKWRGIMLYPPIFWVSVRPSVRPSVSGWSFVSAP